MRRALILTAVLALLPGLAGADEVLLKGGGRISGRILSRTATAVQVDVGAGVITVPMASVLSIEEKRSALDDYEERAAKLRANDVPGWLALARWSLSQGLGTQSRRAYERVLGIEPENVEANQALGRVLVDGRWVTELEVHRARGLVEFEGAWLTPAERDAILVQRDARFNELLRLDAERRTQLRVARAARSCVRPKPRPGHRRRSMPPERWAGFRCGTEARTWSVATLPTATATPGRRTVVSRGATRPATSGRRWVCTRRTRLGCGLHIRSARQARSRLDRPACSPSAPRRLRRSAGRAAAAGIRSAPVRVPHQQRSRPVHPRRALVPPAGPRLAASNARRSRLRECVNQ